MNVKYTDTRILCCFKITISTQSCFSTGNYPFVFESIQQTTAKSVNQISDLMSEGQIHLL
jgi:hypothetical protein